MSDPDSSCKTLTSGQLARLAGVSADSLRYYERCGLLPKAVRSNSGYRQFPLESLPRVRLIKAALSIGFTIEELARVFQARDGGVAPCHQVRELAQQKLALVEEQILELTRMRTQLKSTLAEWNRTLRRTQKGQRAGLLESFAARHPEAARTPSPLLSPPLRRKFSNSRSNFSR